MFREEALAPSAEILRLLWHPEMLGSLISSLVSTGRRQNAWVLLEISLKRSHFADARCGMREVMSIIYSRQHDNEQEAVDVSRQHHYFGCKPEGSEPQAKSSRAPAFSGLYQNR